MNRNPIKRLGSGSQDSEEIKAHPFFEGLIWEKIYQRNLPLPKPIVKDVANKENIFMTDTSIVKGGDKIEGWDFLSKEL